MISEIDKSIRKYLSVLFRLLIIGYSLSILLRFENHFQWYYYLLGFVVYLAIYFTCFGKDGKHGLRPYFRLINDYSLFYLVLYAKPIEDPHVLLLILLPIINALNHSGEKKGWLRVVPMYMIALALIYVLNEDPIPISILVSIATLAIINLFLSIRVSILNYIDKLNGVFEEFNLGNAKDRKHHNLLIELVDKFKDLPLILKVVLFTPENLICYRLIKGKLVIKSSSSFVLQSEVTKMSSLVNELHKEDNIVFNHTIVVNGDLSTNNVFIKIALDNSVYVFVFILESDDKSDINKSSINKLFITKFLKSPLIKVARIIDYENKIKGERRKILEQYKTKFKTLEDTRDTLHFVKNKLSPVYTYFDLLNRQEEKGVEYSEQLNEAKDRIPGNLASIKKKSKPFLDNKFSPYNPDSMDLVSLKKLFRVIMDSFQEELESDYDFIVDSTEGIDRMAEINIDMLEFLISEIVMNANKHSIDDIVILEFSFEPEEFIVSVRNKVKNMKSKGMMMKLFNVEHVTLALERNFNGLTLLKRNLLKLDISHSLFIDEESFSINLKIKTHEDSNI